MDRVAGHQVLRSLGAGTTGRVYLVEVRGVRRALKILHADERGRRASRALRSEFDLLREMIHPNLVRVGDIGLTEEGRTWFTAEYVDGTSIEEAAAGLDRPALVAVVAQILRALEFVHRRGLVHFDLHGSNVRITPEGRVKLLDFGLAGRAGRPLRGVRGTWPFVAPEVLAGGTPDRRADLFSLGVLLARCLGVGEVDGPPDPFRLGEGDGDRLPPELRRVVPRLLEPNPERRYGRAREALRDLASAAGRMLPEETTETLRAHVQFAPFVGRRREVRIVPRMIRALEHPPEGRRGERLPRVVLLEGEAGVGKSRLLREWIHRVAPEGVRVVRARCREGREGAYDPVPELVAGLLDLPGDLPPGLLERHGAVLSRIVPEILAPEGPTPPEDRSRLLTDLSDLVLRLAEGRPGSAAPPRPILLAVEDVHLAGEFLIAFLEALTRDLLAKGRSAPPLVVAATLREESTRAAAIRFRLGAIPGARTVTLPRFRREEVAELLRSMLGVAPAERFVAQLLERTGGNAFFIEALLERMVEVGGLRVREGQWHVVESKAFRVPESVRVLLRGRLRGLSPAEKEVLRTLAVFGEPVPAELIGVLLPEPSLREAAEALLERRVLEETAGGALDLHDPLAADVVLAEIPPDERARRHGAIGDVLRRCGGRRWFDRVAHHLSLGDDADLGLRYALRAAVRLRRRGAEDRAVEYLERALRFVNGPDAPRVRTRILSRIGDMERARGRLRRAERCYRTALEEDLAPRVRARLLRFLGEVLSVLGSSDEALRCCRKALRILGTTETLERVRLQALQGAVHQRQGRYRQAVAAARRGLEILAGRPRLEGAQLMSLLGNVTAETGDLEKATAFHEKSLQLCRSLDHPEGVARGLHNLGVVHAVRGDPWRSARYYREALRILEDRGRLPAVALTLNNLGNLLAERGDLEEAELHHRRALRLRRHVGDAYGVAMSVGNQGSLDRLRGRWGRAFLGYRRAFLSFRELGSVYGETLFLTNQADLLLAIGDLRRASVLADRAFDQASKNRLRRLEARLHLVMAERDRLAGDAISAGRRAAKSFDLAEAIGYKVCAAEADLLRARLAAVAGRTDRATHLLERARQAAQERRGGDLLARFHRASGIVRILLPRGDRDEARRSLEAAESAARELRRPGDLLDAAAWLAVCCLETGAASEARVHLAVAEETAGEIARSLPRRLRTVYLEDPRRTRLERIGARLDGRDVEIEAMDSDKLTRLLQVNKRINSETDLRRLLDFIMDTAIELTGAERGFLLLTERTKVVFQVARNLRREEVDAPEREISRRIVSRVVKTGEPILSDNATEDPRFEKFVSVSDLNLTSILSLPFRVKDRTIGAIYLDNRFQRGAFTADDRDVLSALSDQAAIAIDNIRRQQEITRLNRQLAEKLERQTDELDRARQALEERSYKYDYDDIVGRSSAMKRIFLILDKVVESEVPVLIQGESGTGKELIARAIHRNSARKENRFVAVNCGAIPVNLLESEFFGHVRGAFTGAVEDKKGLFLHAHGGTLFLDEIGDMDLEMQKKLLRVLQEGEVRPVGGKRLSRVDVRIISATNKDLKEEMKAGRFREDLYYRINVINIDLPPLRERGEDVAELARHFLLKTAREMGIPAKAIDDDAMRALVAYPWRGNVRELENELKRATALSDDRITRDDLSPQILESGEPEADGGREPSTLKEKVEQAERAEIRRALENADGNQTRAAKDLGISRVWLRKKMERYGLLK
jgi:serine/threonine-protein kinase PknK